MPSPAVRSPSAPPRAISRVLVVSLVSPPSGADICRPLRRAGLIVRPTVPGDLPGLLAGGAWDVLVIDAKTGSAAATLLIRAVRDAHSAVEMPVLVLATELDPEARAAAVEAGANDWVARPCAIAELSRRLDNLSDGSRLRRAWPRQQQAFREQLSSRTSSLDALIETGLMMSMERDRTTLLRQLLLGGRRLLNCDGATMFLVTDRKTLRFESRTRDDALPSHEIPLYDPVTGLANDGYISVAVALHKRSVLIDDVYTESRFDLSGTRAFDSASAYRTVSMLTVPIAPRSGEAIGVLQFMNALDAETGHVVPFPPDLVGPIEALAAQAAVTLDNLNLVAAQKDLMESMIRVLATAIDAKSPYTGRHCERVPELAFLLADAACKATDGPLADFSFRNEEEWQEFRIGAWLHDCGKVTTPEYVIDKATKLETIYNRVHEIRTRFEVLLRDVHIERLQARLDGTLTDAAEARLADREAQLQSDFAFVAHCNIGSEAMDQADADRLARIAATPWTRHFDDRLGLSGAELARHAATAPAALPATERLLTDKASDVIARAARDVPDPAFGFKMDVPEHLYNNGELYNLGIRRGTLNAEERFKINEHMVHTVMMLERMPFPPNLRRVPEYAGTHHERIDGKGYPRRLTGDQLSVPSRIMAIADIFEALTASDRPYKAPKKLSEALPVLRSLAGEHIDTDLFNLFLTSGVYRDFARRHLTPAQLDVDDVTPYLVQAAP